MKILPVFFFALLLIFNPLNLKGQETQNDTTYEYIDLDYLSFDLFPLDLSINYCYRIQNKHSIGARFDIGYNFSSYILMAGGHFSSDKTPIQYEERDKYDNEEYYGHILIGAYTRLFFDKKMPIDLGIMAEGFYHADDRFSDFGSGYFQGIYLKVFTPSKFKYRDNEKKRRPSFGLEFSIGQFVERNKKEWGMMATLWTRINAGYN